VRPDKSSEGEDFDGESGDELKRRSGKGNFPKRISLGVFLPAIFALY
jgi:hypothetical protein